MKLNVKKLEAERKRLGVTKGEFSRRFGLSESSYRKMILSESTTLATLSKLADVLYLDAKDLLLS